MNSCVLDALNHQLADAIADRERHRLARVEVDDDDLDLATVTRIDRARRIH